MRRTIGTAIFILGIGGLGLWATLHFAPRVEDRIAAGAVEAVADATHPVAVLADGRGVRLTGLVDSAEERAALRAAVSTVPGLHRVDAAGLQVLAPLDPFVTEGRKTDDGLRSLSGGVPTEAARAELGPRADSLTLASGAARGWPGSVRAAEAALDALQRGAWRHEDGALRVTGVARSDTDRDRALAALDGTGAQADIAVIPEVAPFTTAAEKTAEGTRLSGHRPPGAPDPYAAAGLTAADYAPDGWLVRVTAAHTAMQALVRGSWTLTDGALALGGDARSAADRAAAHSALAGLDPPADVEIRVVPLVAPYTTTLEKTPDGITLSGHVPDPALRDALGPAAAGLVHADGAPQDWSARVAAARAALDALAEGRVRLSDTAVSLDGIARDAGARLAAFAALTPFAGPGHGAGQSEVPEAAAADAAAADAAEETAAAGAEGVTGTVAVVPLVAPFVTRLETDGATLRLTGHAPARRDPAQLPAGTALLPRADGAPDDWAELVVTARDALAPLARGSVVIEDRSLRLDGVARDAQAAAAARAALGDAPANIAVVPRVAPFVTGMTWAEEAPTTVSGHVPYGVTAPPGLDLPVADGAPADWSERVAAAQAAMAELAEGGWRIEDRRLTFEGTARTDAARDRALAALAPARPDAVAVDVVPRIAPFVTSGRTESGVESLAGHGPAGADLPAGLAVGAGAPPDWAARVAAARRAAQALHAATWRLEDRALTLTGIARSEDARAAALDALTGLDEPAPAASVRVVPAVSPWRTGATKARDGTLRLTGFAPTEAEAAATGLPQGAGAPPDWSSLVEAAQAALDPLAYGAWTLLDDRLSLTGTARDAGAQARALAALDGLNADAAIAVVPVATPYLTGIAKTAEGLRWSGAVPSAGTRDSVPGDVVHADGAPPDWAGLIAAAQAALDPLTEGRVTLEDRRMTLVGRAETRGARYRASSVLAGLPADVARFIDVTVPLPDFRLTFDAGTGAQATGRLPQGVSRAALAGALDLPAVTGSAAPMQTGLPDAPGLRDLAGDLAPWLPFAARAELVWQGGSGRLSVAMQPGVPLDPVRAALARSDVALEVTRAAAPADGAERRNAATGTRQVAASGHWRPVDRFNPVPSVCTDRAAAILNGAGEAMLRPDPGATPQGQAALERLAALVDRCARNGALIGDLRAPGGAAPRLRRALIARGVPDWALTTGRDPAPRPPSSPVSLTWVQAP